MLCVFIMFVPSKTDGVNLKVNYKDLIEILMCDINNYVCV